MGSEVVQIKILGTSFSIRSDQDPDYISEIIQYMRQKTEEIQKSTASADPLRTAVLAGMLITDELFKERQRMPGVPENTEASREAAKLTAEIIKRLESSLQGE